VEPNEVTAWVDQRLQDEYYWLDIYKENIVKFDYSLDYDKFLSTSLLSLTGNEMDGYTSNGTRYLYSYITRESTGRAADDRMVNSFGIIIAPNYYGGDEEGTAMLVVEHVYPGSPAAEAGLVRGNLITKVDGATIPAPTASLQQFYTLRNKLEYGTGSMTIEGERMDRKSGRYLTYRHSLTSADYDPSPVAYYSVLKLDEEINAQINPDGKKIGYLSYLGFESEFNDDLIEALSYLAARGVTDLILDLRLNGGGSVDTSTMLGSMLLSEDYVGKTYATLKRNPENKLFPKNELDTECLIVKNGIGEEFENTDLPNLNLPELWVITSSYTASASEMVIKGLEGLDVPVKLVGKTTNGKNCGMDVMEKVFGTYKYTYAPITFMNYNAKGDNDYSDGIKPGAPVVSGVSGVDFDKHYSPANPTKDDLSYECYAFPIPRANWAELNFTKSENGGYNFSGDFALYETVLRICGRTMLRSTASLSQVDIKFAEMATTRAMKAREVYDSGIVSTRRAYGATLTEAERLAIERAK
jgi:C-terminal processing protease CtpA/Prc